MSENAVIDAITRDDPASLARLLAADPALAGARDEQGRSAVLLARYYNRAAALAALLAARPPLDIFEAAAVGDHIRVRAIVAGEPEALNAFAPDGFFPLGLAAFFGHAEALRALLDAGADVHVVARNPTRVQAIHAAVAEKPEESAVALATALLDAGADPNARQQGGFTPLHAAAQNGHADLVALLLARGADPTLRTDDEQSASDLAAAGGFSALAAHLRSR